MRTSDFYFLKYIIEDEINNKIVLSVEEVESIVIDMIELKAMYDELYPFRFCDEDHTDDYYYENTCLQERFRDKKYIIYKEPTTQSINDFVVNFEKCL